MISEQNQHISCRSIFKNGTETVSREEFTQKWIEIIRETEKQKRILLQKSQPRSGKEEHND